MQLTAKLLTLLPLQTGKGKNGDWKKQDFIVETGDTYPKKICISVLGDKINSSVMVVGNELKIDFAVESREYNGRWYTDVKAWKIEMVSTGKIQETFAYSLLLTSKSHWFALFASFSILFFESNIHKNIQTLYYSL